MNKPLTNAEEQIMQILWELKKASVKEIIQKMNNPKPAYNTVSTIVRILETKGVVGHKPKGRGHIYFPLIEKLSYSNQRLKSLINGYFDGSFKSMVSFFVSKNEIDVNELDTLMKMINKKEKDD